MRIPVRNTSGLTLRSVGTGSMLPPVLFEGQGWRASLLRSLCEGARFLDSGCSWGFYVFGSAGFAGFTLMSTGSGLRRCAYGIISVALGEVTGFFVNAF